MEQEIIIVDHQPSDGSLVVLDLSKIPTFYKELDLQRLGFNVSNREMLTCLFSFIKDSNVTIVSIQEMVAQTGWPLQTVRNRVRSLRSKSLLTKFPFKYRDGSKTPPKAVCEVLDLNAYLDNHAVPLIAENTDKANNALLAARNRNTRLLAVHELDSLPKVSKDNLPTVVRHLGNHPVEQLVKPVARRKGKSAPTNKSPDREQARHFYVSNAEGNTVKVPCKIRSYMNIMDHEDLQVLYACYTLIFQYHKKALPKHRQNGTLPKNLTPVHIHSISAMIGRARSGPNNAVIRDCLYAIDDTQFDFHGLAEVELADSTLHGYAKMEYKNFKYFTPLTDKQAEIDDKQQLRFGDDATIYLISLPDTVFEALMEEDQVFAFPESALTVPPIVFSLYLRFRARCKGPKQKYDTPLSSLHSSMTGASHKSKFTHFKHLLKSSFELLMVKDTFRNKEGLEFKYSEDSQEYTFNLWGYHGRLSFKEDYLTVTCDLEEMLKYCKAGTGDNSGSPVIDNEISELYADTLNKKISRQFGKFVDRKFKKYSVVYPLSNSTSKNFELSKYTSDDDIEMIANYFGKLTNKLYASVEVQIRAELEMIKGLELCGEELTSQQFSDLMDALDIDLFSINEVDIIHRFSRNTRYHEELLSVAKGATPSLQIMTRINALIESIAKSNNRSLTPMELLDSNLRLELKSMGSQQADTFGIEDANFTTLE
ncbi:DUF3346 domain-containing protein [Vibrio sp. SCSIO 43140]|uniref:replication initiator protein RctB domain-containing protein n=1 Tax=Vibrio sp. SCSIO 43140 TaxID=2819100 RepID=UPI0020759ABA|nr:replication initiator protein RctB domain-containing protein [Vibrio sp. SCSIO 43140]USD59066.1 DUF3346 domain-containing protein [Vibrio sp. SCSIO 43140]